MHPSVTSSILKLRMLKHHLLQTDFDYDLITTRRDEPQPEILLLYAILERAILDLRFTSAEIRPIDRAAAYTFFLDRSRDEFSFLWICEQLSLDPNHIIRLIDPATPLPKFWVQRKFHFCLIPYRPRRRKQKNA